MPNFLLLKRVPYKIPTSFIYYYIFLRNKHNVLSFESGAANSPHKYFQYLVYVESNITRRGTTDPQFFEFITQVVCKFGPQVDYQV